MGIVITIPDLIGRNESFICPLYCFFAGCLCQGQEETTSMPQCEGFTCPNNEMEGGLFALGCSGDFCDCSYGVPYLKHCEEANPPLFFNEAAQVCDWCFSMCYECANECSACK